MFLFVAAMILVAGGLGVTGPALAALPNSGNPDIQTYDFSLTKGLIRYGDGQYDEAERLFRQALQAKPGDPVATEQLAQTLLRTKHYGEAEDLFRQILQTTPASGRAWLGLGIAQYHQERYEEARSSLAEADKYRPRDPQVAYYQGLVLAKLKAPDQATTRLDDARRMSPDLSTESEYQKGIAYYEQGAVEQARTAFQGVANSAADTPLGQSARQYLDLLKGGAAKPGKRWDLTFSVSPQYDSNVVLAPLGTQPIGGSTGISRKDDYLTALYGRGEFRALQTDDWTAGVSYSIYQNFHSTLSGFDVQDHTPTAFLQYRTGPVQARLQYVFDYVNVGRSPYLISNAFLPILTLAEAKNTFTEVRFGYQYKDFQHGRFLTNSNRDGINWMAGFNQYFLFGEENGFIRAGYTFDSDRTGGGSPAVATPGVTTNADWAYEGHKVYVGLGIPPVLTLRLNLDFEYYRQNYDNPNSFSITGTTKRRDDIYLVTGTISRPLTRTFSIAAQYTYVRDDANIAVFNYVRSIAALILSGQF